jgi:hypothetical protein
MLSVQNIIRKDTPNESLMPFGMQLVSRNA